MNINLLLNLFIWTIITLGSAITPEVHVNTVASAAGKFRIRAEWESYCLCVLFKIWTHLSTWQKLYFMFFIHLDTFESLIKVQELVPKILVLFEYAMKSWKSSWVATYLAFSKSRLKYKMWCFHLILIDN